MSVVFGPEQVPLAEMDAVMLPDIVSVVDAVVEQLPLETITE